MFPLPNDAHPQEWFARVAQDDPERVKMGGIVSWLHIQPVAGGVYLFESDSKGISLADSWHASVEDAKLAAEVMFELTEHSWTTSAPPWRSSDPAS